MFLLFEIVTFVARSRSVVIERLGKIGGGGKKFQWKSFPVAWRVSV